MLTTSTHVHYYLLSSVSITYFVFSEASVLNKTERIYLRKERDVCQLSRERGERGEERGERGEGEGERYSPINGDVGVSTTVSQCS